MIIKSNFVERRKSYRFKAKEGTFAEFHKSSIFRLGKSRIVKSAQIVDISFDGLAFQYIDHTMWTPNFNELSISKAIDGIKIEKIPFKALSDFSISRLPNSLLKRRCGVKFGALTPNQKNQLHYFIQDHTRSHQSVDRRTGKGRRQLEASKHGGLEKRNEIERRERLMSF